ncbi:hypothetical protein QBC46DRAFT_253295, partial [Diplogelasinospora grovesii]
FKEIKIELLRIFTRFQNYIVKNPAIKITLIITYDSFKEIISPNLKMFPRNAKEFYIIRDTSNERYIKMLNYLIGFYDLTVEMLENILSLNEENFIRFKERAAALARRSP